MLNRPLDPVVIAGDRLEALNGLAVDKIVGFRFQDLWQQIPIQIDQRKYADFGAVYNGNPLGIGVICYADPNTYVGPDTDPNFDGDDELVFMAKDVGERAVGCAGLPLCVLADTCTEVEIYDPLEESIGYVYLFESDGNLAPDAGQDYVSYTFNLLAGDYIPDYNLNDGPNPEDSQAWSEYYRTHFSDRWISDGLNIFAGGATGVDILDRHKNMFSPGNCGRTEDTFSDGEGAFFTNKDGHIRAIRSYMGCNSGPLTQRQHLFYEQRQDITTFVRVHAIPSVVDLFDYSPAATGMFYYNDLNQDGVLVDGQPDSVTAGPVIWEMVTGLQGSLVISHSVETDIDPFSYTSYYSDDTSPTYTQCTGDAYEYATSGLWIDHEIPNTDPRPWYGAFNTLSFRRIMYHQAPGQTVDTAVLRHQQAGTDLEVAVYPYGPCAADLDGDYDVDLRDYVAFALRWLETECNEPDWCSGADSDRSGTVDFNDLDNLACYWLWGK